MNESRLLVDTLKLVNSFGQEIELVLDRPGCRFLLVIIKVHLTRLFLLDPGVGLGLFLFGLCKCQLIFSHILIKDMPIAERVLNISEQWAPRHYAAERSEVDDCLFFDILWSHIFLHVLLNKGIHLLAKLSFLSEALQKPIHVQNWQGVVFVTVKEIEHKLLASLFLFLAFLLLLTILSRRIARLPDTLLWPNNI